MFYWAIKYVLLSEGIDDVEEKTSVGPFFENIPDFILFKFTFLYCVLIVIYLSRSWKNLSVFTENEQKIIHV